EQTQNELNDANIRLKDLNDYVAQLLQQIELFKAHVSRLENQLREIFESTSWKLSKPLRVVGRLFKGQPLQPPPDKGTNSDSNNEN
ncbi:MAG: hypothetical protein RL120_14945, partial [Gammaproteobacteria bacterium]